MDDHATRLRCLRLRSWRRGTREMDLILGPFADARLPDLDAGGLDAFEGLLVCNDHDLYLWIGGRGPAPQDHAAIVSSIQRFHGLS